MRDSRVLLLPVVAILGLGIAAWLIRDGEVVDEAAAARGNRSLEASPGASPTLAEASETSRPVEESSSAAARRTVEREEPAARAERQAPAAPAELLVGSVVDAQGRTLPDAEVWVSRIGEELTAAGLGQRTHSAFVPDDPDSWTRTGTDGRFEILRGGRKAGSVRVEVWARGYQHLSTSRTLGEREGGEHLGVFALEPGVVLSGIVLTYEGDALPGARVRPVSEEPGVFRAVAAFSNSQGGVDSGETTDAEGRFELAHVAPGSYRFEVDHERHPTTTFEGLTGPAGLERDDLVLRMQAGAAISGRIVGFPVEREGVRVGASRLDDEAAVDEAAMELLMNEMFGAGPTGVVQSDGTFTIHGLLPGRRYELQALDTGTFLQRIECTDAIVTAAPDATAELQWDAGTRLEFDVVDDASGERLGPVVVHTRWDGGALEGMPDFGSKAEFPTGEVELKELRAPSPLSELRVRVAAEDYLDVELEPVELRGRDLLDLGTVSLVPSPRIRVHVVDAATGAPVKRASVRWIARADDALEDEVVTALGSPSPTTRGKTDREGVCELRPPTVGRARLEVGKGGFADTALDDLDVSTGGAHDFHVALSAGGTLVVTVLDEQGRPVPGSYVEHVDPEGKQRRRRVRDRQIELENLVPGEHGVRLAAPTPDGPIGVSVSISMQANLGREDDPGEERWERVRVADGTRVEVVLTAPGKANVRGRVTLDGTPLVGAQVAWLPGARADPLADLISRVQEQSLGLASGSDAVRTDTAGSYSIDDVTAGEHRLRVTHADLALPFVVEVDLANGDNTVDVDIRDRAIEGVVLDDLGAPVAGASLAVHHRPASGSAGGVDLEDLGQAEELLGLTRTVAKTDDAGRFRLGGLPHGGPFVVTAEAPGWTPASSEPIEVPEGRPFDDLEIRLLRGGSLRVRVIGEPSGPLLVTAEFVGESEAGGGRDRLAFVQNGTAVFDHLLPGTWRVELEGAESSPAEEVEVTPGAESLVTLSL